MNTYELTYSKYVECPENGTNLEPATCIIRAHSKYQAEEMAKKFYDISLVDPIIATQVTIQ